MDHLCFLNERTHSEHESNRFLLKYIQVDTDLICWCSSFHFLHFGNERERLRRKGNVWLSSIGINFLHSFRADKNNALGLIIFSLQLFSCEQNWDSPRLVRRNCDGAFGASSSGASSMKLVVQILSLPANVPTEWRRACDDPSTIEPELCDKL